MGWQIIVALVVMVPVMLAPVAMVWFLQLWYLKHPPKNKTVLKQIVEKMEK